MSTLYVRDVPPAVSETLKRRAAEAGMSLSAYLAAELTRMASRPSNAEIAERLRARERASGPTADEIVDALRAGRR
ncbi:antitoxin [Isoptericola sp. NPDC057391]|uniref:FitA-like ribbon-helix-helix domain-containing protein n=1 Tax=Isoptericola sp. NPDC057391 TaxID=3346117 RepID=UPI0036416875